MVASFLVWIMVISFLGMAGKNSEPSFPLNMMKGWSFLGLGFVFRVHKESIKMREKEKVWVFLWLKGLYERECLFWFLKMNYFFGIFKK